MKQKPNILVVGSFVMDQIVSTDIFPREGQTVFAQHFRKAPGGKGANQAVQAARLGANVTMIGKLGHDANGSELLEACRNAGINTDHVLFDDEVASGCAVIILEKAPDGSTKNRIMVIPGSNMRITKEDLAFLENTIQQYDFVILQLEIPMDVNEYVAALAHSNGIPVMLNPAPSAPLSDSLLSHLSFLSPNEHEAADLTGIHIGHDGKDINFDDLSKAAHALLNSGVENVLITLGSAGAALFNQSGMFYQPSAKNAHAIDPTAAGDSFVAAFCYGVCCDLCIDDVLIFANQTAAITVSHMGAIPSLPTLSAVEKALSENNHEFPKLTKLYNDY